jgi:hypothetical protein
LGFFFPFSNFAPPDFHQRPGQPPDHLPDEVRRLDAEHDQIVVDGDLGRIHNYDGRFTRLRGIGRSKRHKVVAARDKRSGLLHTSDVQWFLDPPDEAFRKGRLAG